MFKMLFILIFFVDLCSVCFICVYVCFKSDKDSRNWNTNIPRICPYPHSSSSPSPCELNECQDWIVNSVLSWQPVLLPESQIPKNCVLPISCRLCQRLAHHHHIYIFIISFFFTITIIIFIIILPVLMI